MARPVGVAGLDLLDSESRIPDGWWLDRFG
jgi:hypothetical protein